MTEPRRPWADRADRRPEPGNAKTLRAQAWRTHGDRCHICGTGGADAIDHVLPLAEGGGWTVDNMRPIHSEPCHRAKTADEAARGRARRLRMNRPPERHPGLL